MSSAIEIIGLISGIIYVILEILKKNSMWIVGLITAGAYIVLYAMEELYASMGLQIYYFIVSFYGIWQWHKLKKSNDKDGILLKGLSPWEIVFSLAITVGCYFLLLFLLSKYTGDPQPELDSIVTVLSMLGTYWLTKSYINQWYVWIIANIVGIVLSLYQGLFFTSALYSFYLFSAIFGLCYWEKNGVYVK
jgi:nicotinamide mononucleotide transporter